MTRITRVAHGSLPIGIPALALGILAGCATFHARPISPERSLAVFEARRLDSAETRRAVEAGLTKNVAPWPPARWDLAMLTPVALHYSANLAAAEAHAEAAAADVKSASEYPNPRFTFTPGYSTNPPADASPWILGYALSFPVPTGGRRGAGIGRARALGRATMLDTAAAAWQVRNRLRRRLLGLYAAEQKSALLRQQIKTEKQAARLLQARLEAGEVAEPVVLLARSAYEATERALAAAEADAATSRATLAAALGLPRRALHGVQFAFGAFTRPLPASPAADVRRRALLNRPEILAALARYEASQYALKREIARQYPNLEIGPGFMWDQGEHKWSLAIGIALPVFNQNRGAIDAARARRREAAAHFEAVQNRVIAQVEQAYAAYEGARERVRLAERAARSARRAADAVTMQFQAGETGALALLDARNAAVAAELARLDVLKLAQTSLAELENALERPLPTPASAARVARAETSS